jgi:hypothetical protein
VRELQKPRPLQFQGLHVGLLALALPQRELHGFSFEGLEELQFPVAVRLPLEFPRETTLLRAAKRPHRNGDFGKRPQQQSVLGDTGNPQRDG